MKIAVRRASRSERPRIDHMLNRYLGELARYREIAVGATDAAEYPYLDHYWSDPDRFPFLIWSDGNLVGFALCRRIRDGRGDLMQLAEFFVEPEHRGRGIGAAASAALFKRFAGRWELQVMCANRAASEFWRRCIGREALAWNVEEITAPDGRRLFFHFEAGGVPPTAAGITLSSGGSDAGSA